jgi:hypothetical protein
MILSVILRVLTLTTGEGRASPLKSACHQLSLKPRSWNEPKLVHFLRRSLIGELIGGKIYCGW